MGEGRELSGRVLRTNKSKRESFLRAAHIRERCSRTFTLRGIKAGPKHIYWARGGSWWPQFLLDRLLMSGNTAAMQVFIFCYKNYAKSTGADAIKDRTALEGSHQMLSCSVTHAASVPNSSFSGAQHLWFRVDLVLIFPLTQQSEQSVEKVCGLCEF